MSKYEIVKLSNNLQVWHVLEFKEFLTEFEKARKQIAKTTTRRFSPLHLSEEAEWMQYFNEQKQKARKLKAEIDKTDKEIDHVVCKLSELTEEEIKKQDNQNK
jgi:seryl-tRNA synthetase